MIIHYDLFAGIGGFSIAVDEVFDEPVRHIFCEWDSFCTQVLKKHWPDGEFWGDIAELVTHTDSFGRSPRHREVQETDGEVPERNNYAQPSDTIILTGGFPCQPFSAAGRRRGTADDRYKWPEMFAVIRNIKPDWVIAENVRGLVNWSEGLVLEQVCADLESQNYEVQPLIIPAVAKNAPHRRDRVWIIGYSESAGKTTKRAVPTKRTGDKKSPHNLRTYTGDKQDAQNTPGEGLEGTPRGEQSKSGGMGRPSWSENWPEVATELCLVDDGLSSQLVRLPDGTEISYPKWRKESLKAGGNAIVPQVAIEIMRAIRDAEKQEALL